MGQATSVWEHIQNTQELHLLEWHTRRQQHMVERVEYQYVGYGNFHIDSLPHTTRIILIDVCHQKYTIQTRSLPRALAVLTLYRNITYGTIDVGNLPPHFVDLAVPGNNIYGPISLKGLPRTMEKLQLNRNILCKKLSGIEICRTPLSRCGCTSENGC